MKKKKGHWKEFLETSQHSIHLYLNHQSVFQDLAQCCLGEGQSMTVCMCVCVHAVCMCNR